MIWRKSTKFFSTMLLTAIILLGQINLPLLAESSNEAPSTGTSSVDNVSILGGIGPIKDDEAYKVNSEAVLVYNMDERVIVYSKNIDKKLYPASLTKIMTALIVLEAIEKEESLDLDQTAEFPWFVTAEFDSGGANRNKNRNVSTAGFNTDTPITIRHALYGMMLNSGCDAANILAYNIGKGEPEDRVDNFIQMMNDKAASLDAKNTNFSNTHGLFEEENYTTARDVFLITRYVYEKYPLFAEIVDTIEYNVPKSEYNPNGNVINTNALLEKTSPYYYAPNPGEGFRATGIKTGGFPAYYIDDLDGDGIRHDGIANLVSIAQVNGYSYLIVTLEAPWNDEPGVLGLHYAYRDHRAFFDWAFDSFKKAPILRDTEPVAILRVLDGKTDKVQLFPKMLGGDTEFWTLLPVALDGAAGNSAVNRVIKLEKNECTCDNRGSECVCIIEEGVITAPIIEGKVYGKLELWVNNALVKSFDLVAGESVEMSLSAKNKIFIDSFVGTLWFRLTLGFVGALSIVLIIMNYIHKHRKRGRQIRRAPNRRIRR